MRRERSVSFIRTWNLGFLSISHEHKSATNLRSKCWNYAQIWNVFPTNYGSYYCVSQSLQCANHCSLHKKKKFLVKEISKPFTSSRGWHSWTSTTGLMQIPAPLWKLPTAQPLDVTSVLSPAWDADRAVDKQDFLMAGKRYFFLLLSLILVKRRLNANVSVFPENQNSSETCSCLVKETFPSDTADAVREIDAPLLNSALVLWKI